jgi:hypothetical protein
MFHDGRTRLVLSIRRVGVESHTAVTDADWRCHRCRLMIRSIVSLLLCGYCRSDWPYPAH